MSAAAIFLEIERLKNKIDRDMQMAIWTRFFPLLVNPNDSISLTLGEFQEFIVTVAQLSVAHNIENNVAITSQFVHPGNAARAEQTSQPPAGSARGIFNLFPTRTTTATASSTSKDINAAIYRKSCQKLLQYYTLSNTTLIDFKVSDLVGCMIYLSQTPQYRPLYLLLETSFDDEHECMPNLAPDQVQHLIDLLRSLLDLPSSLIDFNNLKILKTTIGKSMNYPLTRFPRIILMPGPNRSKDRSCTLKDLIIERSSLIHQLESQQCINEDSKIPYCDDESFINEILKSIDAFPVHRMFYNAVNSIFYTTMENYAVANCKFDINDYNNIYKINSNDYNEMCNIGGGGVGGEYTDSLNISLSKSGSGSMLTKKRKIY
ncbi:ac101 [Malacosoma neustria nucleopolyhedrovirus]|uniref:ac101 n=1 Tax=Malacosoma neustria nuclear polyhedrosis virus TaxID=38012 RepID=UPI000E360B0B|nr:ac101 [Malacosoma neustria nucleopolyhedrovirus]AUF81611.1 ac101 [Malacosoma neustria nucleopolyhedrovirus]